MSLQSSPSSPFPTPAPNLGPEVDPKQTPDVPLPAAIIRASEDAIFSTTLQGIVTSWNPAAVRLFGYTAEQMIGSFTTLPFFPERLKEKEALLDNLHKGRPIKPFEATQLHKDGMAFRVTLTVFPIRNTADEVNGIAMIASRIFPPPPVWDDDRTELQSVPLLSAMPEMSKRLAQANEHLLLQIVHESEQSAQLEMQKAGMERANRRLEDLNAQLEALATTDGLTGLKNHRNFHERLREEVRRADRYGLPLSMLMLDVDRFKTYNDAFGHPAGDAILRVVAEILLATARATDLVARYGGEEFAVILPGTNSDQARAAAERFRGAIETASWPDWPVTASFGAATLSQTTPDAVTLIAQADAALYMSKRIGRNCTTHAQDSSANPKVCAEEPAPRPPEPPSANDPF